MDVFAAAYKDVFTAVAKKFTAFGAGQSQLTLAEWYRPLADRPR
jgi:hypothetical protein